MTVHPDKQAPDRSRSFAILVGASSYPSSPGLQALPAAGRSLDAMERLLKSGLCGWTDDRMLVLHDWTSKQELLARITAVLLAKAEQITDTVLFYYVGHGLLIDGGASLSLALSGTNEEVVWRKLTSLQLSEVRDVLAPLTQATKIEMLDCCYSGIASNTQGSAGALQDRVSRAVEDNSDSRYTVTASRRNEEALYWTTDDGLTYFTGFLDEIVTHGIEGAPAYLTMTRIFLELHERFKTLAATTIDQSVPLPTQLATTMAGEFPFARNAAYQALGPSSARPDEPPDRYGYGDWAGEPAHSPTLNRRVVLTAGAAVAAAAMTGFGVAATFSSGSGDRRGAANSPNAPSPSTSGSGSGFGHPPSPEDTLPPVTGARALGRPLTGFAATVETLAFRPDGKILAGGSYDTTIHLWDVADPAAAAPVGPALTGDTANINTVAFSPDGRTLISGSWDKTIRLWNIANATRVRAIGQPTIGHNDRVNTVAFCPNGKTVASGSNDRTIKLWNLTDSAGLEPACPALTGHTNTVNAVAFSPDGTILASASWDMTIRLWDVSDPAQARAIGQPLVGHTYSVAAVAFSPDGKTLASASWDNTVRLWDVSGPAQAGEIGLPLTGHTDHVQGISYSPDGRTLASGSWDKTIRLWDVSDPAQAQVIGEPLTGHTGIVAPVAFSPTGGALASGSDDKTIRLWILR